MRNIELGTMSVDAVPAAYIFFVQKLLDTAKRQKKSVPENVYIQVWFSPVLKRFFREYYCHCGCHVDSGLNPENDVLKILGKCAAKKGIKPLPAPYVSIKAFDSDEGVASLLTLFSTKDHGLVSLMEQQMILETMKGIEYDKKIQEGKFDMKKISKAFIDEDDSIANFDFLFSCYRNNVMAITFTTEAGEQHENILRSIKTSKGEDLMSKCNATIKLFENDETNIDKMVAKISCEHLYTLMYVLARAAPWVFDKLEEEKKEELWDMFNAWSQILGGFHTLILNDKDTNEIETACIHQFINLVRVHTEFLSQEYQLLSN